MKLGIGTEIPTRHGMLQYMYIEKSTLSSTDYKSQRNIDTSIA